MEVALVKDAAGTTIELGERGYLESDPAAHTSGTRVLLDPTYTRITIFNTLRSVIASLFSYGVYERAFLTTTYNALTPIDLPAVARDSTSVIWVSRGAGLGYNKLTRGQHFEILHLPSGPKLQLYSGGQQGLELVVPYKAPYTLPDSLDDELDDLGVAESLQPHLALGVAASLLLGREVPKLQADHIKRQLEGQNVPVGSLANIGRLLWQTFIQQHVNAERVRLAEISPPLILTGG